MLNEDERKRLERNAKRRAYTDAAKAKQFLKDKEKPLKVQRSNFELDEEERIRKRTRRMSEIKGKVPSLCCPICARFIGFESRKWALPRMPRERMSKNYQSQKGHKHDLPAMCRSCRSVIERGVGSYNVEIASRDPFKTFRKEARYILAEEEELKPETAQKLEAYVSQSTISKIRNKCIDFDEERKTQLEIFQPGIKIATRSRYYYDETSWLYWYRRNVCGLSRKTVAEHLSLSYGQALGIEEGRGKISIGLLRDWVNLLRQTKERLDNYLQREET